MGLFRKLRNYITDNYSSHKPYYSKEGYLQVYRPDSFLARTGSYRNGYVPEHRYKMEKKLKNNPDFVVHHKNGNKWDNRLSNLKEMPSWDHDDLHGFHKHGYPKNRRR